MNSDERRKAKRVFKSQLHHARAVRESSYQAHAWREIDNCLARLIPMQFDGTSRYDKGVSHLKQVHIVYEIKGSKRAFNLKNGKSAGGACTVCRLRGVVPNFIFAHIMEHYALCNTVADKQKYTYLVNNLNIMPQEQWNVDYPLREFIPLEICFDADLLDAAEADDACALRQYEKRDAERLARPKKTWRDYSEKPSETLLSEAAIEVKTLHLSVEKLLLNKD